MILSNFSKAIGALLNYKQGTNSGIIMLNGSVHSQTNGLTVGSAAAAYDFAGGNTVTINSSTSSYANINKYSLVFGGGTTAPSVDDYCIETPYDTTDHFSWVTQVLGYDADTQKMVITGVIQNIADTDLSVSEVGAAAASNLFYNPFLIARSVITPVTIVPGECETFVYTLNLGVIAG